jgi:hypothetical protein
VTASLVRIVNKIFAAIVMGHVGWFVIGFPIMLAVAPSLAADPNPSVGWTFLGPGIAVVTTNGLVSSLGLPLAGILFSVLLRHQPAVSDAAKTGAKISTGLGGMIESGMLGLVGFFLGAIFLLLAFAILRNARRPSLPGSGIPD